MRAFDQDPPAEPFTRVMSQLALEACATNHHQVELRVWNTEFDESKHLFPPMIYLVTGHLEIVPPDDPDYAPGNDELVYTKLIAKDVVIDTARLDDVSKKPILVAIEEHGHWPACCIIVPPGDGGSFNCGGLYRAELYSGVSVVTKRLIAEKADVARKISDLEEPLGRH